MSEIPNAVTEAVVVGHRMTADEGVNPNIQVFECMNCGDTATYIIDKGLVYGKATQLECSTSSN